MGKLKKQFKKGNWKRGFIFLGVWMVVIIANVVLEGDLDFLPGMGGGLLVGFVWWTPLHTARLLQRPWLSGITLLVLAATWVLVFTNLLLGAVATVAFMGGMSILQRKTTFFKFDDETEEMA